MKIKKLLQICHWKYNASVVRLLIGFTFVLLLPQVNAAEDTKDAKGTGLQSGDGLPSGDSYLRETDFSKEAGFSRQNGSSRPAGFSKDIIIATGVEHDSNPGSDAKNKNPVWIYSLAPQVLLDYSSEVNRLYFNAALLVQRHSNEKELFDREDPRLAIGWDRTYESGRFGINANYSETSSRGEELRATGVFSATENTSKTKELGAMWEHRIAPRWAVLTEGDYSDNTFTQKGILGDYTLANVRSKLTYENSERLNTYVQLGYAQFSPDKIYKDTDLVRLALGADYLVSEALTVSSRVAVYNLSGRQSDTDWEAGIKLGYNAGRMDYIAELSRELGASGIGGFQKIDVFRLGWLFNISEVDKVGANYALSKSREDKQVDLSKSEYKQISAFYERILSGNWRGQANVSFKELESAGTYSNGNVIGVSLIYDKLSF